MQNRNSRSSQTSDPHDIKAKQTTQLARAELEMPGSDKRRECSGKVVQTGKQRRRLLREKRQGITKPVLRRLARAGGVKHLSDLSSKPTLCEILSQLWI